MLVTHAESGHIHSKLYMNVAVDEQLQNCETLMLRSYLNVIFRDNLNTF